MKKKGDNPVVLLLKWAGKDRIYLYMSVALSLISGLSTMVPYYGVYKIIEGAYSESLTREGIIKYVFLISLAIVTRFSFFGIAGVLSHKGAYNALFKVRCMVIEHMAKIPLGRLNERDTGEIKTVLNEKIENLELFLAHHFPEFIYYLSGPVAVFLYLCTVNIKLALVSLIPLIMAFLVMFQMFKGASSLMERAYGSISSLNGALIEYISGMKVIKAYNMGSRSFKKYADAVKEENAVWNEMSYKMGPPYAAFIVIIECGLILMVPLGGFMFLEGSITGSIFILFAFIGSLYLTEIRPLQELGSNFAQVLDGIVKAGEILSIEPYEKGGEFPESCEIELKNISFSYDKKHNVIENSSLSIKNGEKIAIVGPSGAGKTTIVQLIARFYDVDKGNILIGGKNIKDIDYEELLQNVSIVFQKTFLTRGSVFENISMDSKASLEDVRDAAKKAQIDSFIMSLPHGYDTLVGSYGSRFSGGEKQRIAIARAILKNAPILILDEATSAADSENQLEIDKAIENLCIGKTVIFVAHRLGITLKCDKVAIVEDNRISCVGSHNKVRESNGYYNKAWKDYEEARCITYGLSGGDVNAFR